MTRTRLILILTLMLALAAGAVAQETKTAAEAAPTTAAERTEESSSATDTAKTGDQAAAVAARTAEAEQAESSTTSHELRSRFSQLLRQHPPEVSTILALDPTILSNQTYMSAYPEIAQFVAAHPEVQRNPRFYLGDFQERPSERNVIGQLMESIAIFATIGLITFALGWLVRTIIEQKRWNRLSRTQTEVHNKILDRFGTSEEVLNYVRSPAGSKFLESAPIPVRAEEPARMAASPMNRVMLSIQLGAGLAVGAAGLLLLSLRFDAETAEGVFALGAIAFCVGAGFIASAIVSILVSKRLDLGGNGGVLPRHDDSGAVR